jgi:phage gpG-like protein
MEDFNNWAKIAEAFDLAQSQVVRKTAFDWQANAQAQIRANHQIDTGFMTNSGYVVTSDSSSYAEKLESITTPSTKPTKSGRPRKLGKRASAIKGRMNESMLPEIAVRPSDKEAYLAFAAAYAWWQNYGTTRIPARPFLEPSKDRTQASFDEALSRIEEKLKQVAHS